MEPQRISLFCREGTSDKVYHLQLEASGTGFVVNYQHGRRDGPLTAGSKTTAPVPYAAALKTYNATVKEKLAKRYKPAQGASAGFTAVLQTQEERFTGVLPQLLHAVEEGQEDFYLDSEEWVMQQKFDGHRRLVKVAERHDVMLGVNRRGLAVPLSRPMAELIASLPAERLVLDGELMGERLFVFDMLEYGGIDIRSWPFMRRQEQLRELFANTPSGRALELIPLYVTKKVKRQTFETLRASGTAEGVTFKLASAPYEPGRPASGGSAMKFKFWHTASVIVDHVNSGKRSVAVCVLNTAGHRVSLGSVTIPANQILPDPGAILEVRYLHAHRDGSLVQATSKELRDDIDASECTEAQLVYKVAEPEETSSPSFA